MYCNAATWSNSYPPIRNRYHWRLSAGQEAGFILAESRRLLPVEIKAGNTVGVNDARHLTTFRERHANTLRGVLVGGDPTIRVLKPGIVAGPWWAILMTFSPT